MIALDPRSTFPHTLAREVGKPDAVTWRVRFLQARELVAFAAVLESLEGGTDDAKNVATMDAVLRIVLRGWDIKTEAGEPLECPKPERVHLLGSDFDALPECSLDRIPLTVHDKGEIVGVAMRASQLGVDDAKKSVSQPA